MSDETTTRDLLEAARGGVASEGDGGSRQLDLNLRSA